MNYHLVINKVGETIQYTEAILLKLIKINGHEIVRINECDVILVSLCDITEIGLLKKTRENFPNKIIICGGAISYFYKVLGLFADYVCVGQGFEFFRLQNIEDFKNQEYIYYAKDYRGYITPSTEIDFNKSPCVQVAEKLYYLWEGVGCQNKCKFCLTSWTNKQQHCNPKMVEIVQKKLGKNSLKLISNEEKTNINTKEAIKDMMLKNYLTSPRPKCRIIRIGLEFATEKSRLIMGKYFTNEELFYAIKKAEKENIMLQFFCIGGIDTREDWLDLFARIPEQCVLNPKIVFKFTNLEYQMHTPLYKERKNIKIENYLDNDFNLEILKYNRARLSRLRTLPIKYPAHSLWRQGISTSCNIQQFDIFWDLRNCKDLNIMYQSLLKSGVLENDYTNEVKFWYKNKNN